MNRLEEHLERDCVRAVPLTEDCQWNELSLAVDVECFNDKFRAICPSCGSTHDFRFAE